MMYEGDVELALEGTVFELKKKFKDLIFGLKGNTLSATNAGKKVLVITVGDGKTTKININTVGYSIKKEYNALLENALLEILGEKFKKFKIERITYLK